MKPLTWTNELSLELPTSFDKVSEPLNKSPRFPTRTFPQRSKRQPLTKSLMSAIGTHLCAMAEKVAEKNFPIFLMLAVSS